MEIIGRLNTAIIYIERRKVMKSTRKETFILELDKEELAVIVSALGPSTSANIELYMKNNYNVTRTKVTHHIFDKLEGLLLGKSND